MSEFARIQVVWLVSKFYRLQYTNFVLSRSPSSIIQISGGFYVAATVNSLCTLLFRTALFTFRGQFSSQSTRPKLFSFYAARFATISLPIVEVRNQRTLVSVFFCTLIQSTSFACIQNFVASTSFVIVNLCHEYLTDVWESQVPCIVQCSRSANVHSAVQRRPVKPQEHRTDKIGLICLKRIISVFIYLFSF